MTIFEFKEFLKDIGIYYERKAPSDGTTEAWFERVKRIPAEPLEWITDKIFETFETYPKNIPNTMWAFYREWIQANPSKMALKNYFDCPECDGEGIITLQKKINGYPYKFVARCTRCRQSDLNGIPYMSTDEPIRGGFEIIKQVKSSHHSVRSKDEVNAIIDRLCQTKQVTV